VRGSTNYFYLENEESGNSYAIWDSTGRVGFGVDPPYAHRVTTTTLRATGQIIAENDVRANAVISTNDSVAGGAFIGKDTSLTNAAGLTIAQEIALATNQLASTNYVHTVVANLGMHVYSSGVTNAGVLAGRTNNWQGWRVPASTITTNTVSSMAANAYIRHVVATNTMTRIDTGPIDVEVYLYRDGTPGGTVSLHPEFYLYDTVNNTLFLELASPPAQTITATAPTLYTWSVSATGYTHTNDAKLVVSWKMDSTPNGGTTLNFVSGGGYDSHATFVQNIASAQILGSQVVGAVALATAAVNATNYYGTLATNNVTGAPTVGYVSKIQANGTVAWSADGGGSPSFDQITGGTSGETLAIGEGGTLVTSGSGTIYATHLTGTLLTNNVLGVPTTGHVPTVQANGTLAYAAGSGGGGGTNSAPIALSFSDTNVAVSCTTPLGCVTNAPLHYRLTMTTNALVQNPSGMGDGQRIVIEFIQDATGSRLAFFDTDFAFGTDITGITLTTTASKRDFATFVYHATTDKWYAVGFTRGY
jgi:hypothetical protein